MARRTQTYAIRLGVEGGGQVKAELVSVGQSGEQSLKRIETAGDRASGGLKGLGRQAELLRTGIRTLGGALIGVTTVGGLAALVEGRSLRGTSAYRLILISLPPIYRSPACTGAVWCRRACNASQRRSPACNGIPQSSLRSPAVARSTPTSRLTSKAVALGGACMPWRAPPASIR
jgi:hypothetical protein